MYRRISHTLQAHPLKIAFKAHRPRKAVEVSLATHITTKKPLLGLYNVQIEDISRLINSPLLFP
jgi:hypothetical protein